MINRIFTWALLMLISVISYGQDYNAGFKSLQLKDSTRIYKPDTRVTDELHYRPVDLDLWYPSNIRNGKLMKFGDLFGLLENRATRYQDNHDYSGLTAELAQFYVAQLGVGSNGKEILEIETESYLNPDPSTGNFPVIIYMAGSNGMGFENFKLLEKLTQKGYMIVSVWSVGRYPGDMTNHKNDMLEQVYDAEFAIKYLKEIKLIGADYNNIGILGCSWGGMSSAVFIERNRNIKAFLSLDGTETHYFGEDAESDTHIRNIYNAKLFSPATLTMPYMYLESGDKLEGFQPDSVYNFYEELNAEKYYLRFLKSTHADFTSIPSMLGSSIQSTRTYEDIERLTLAFFEQTLKNNVEFDNVWDEIRLSENTSEEPSQIKNGNYHVIDGTIFSNQNKPVPYANIGILNREIGTVSDLNGKFSLTFDKIYMDDTIKISSVGFHPVEIVIKDLPINGEPVSIILKEEIRQLNEVVITAESLKQKTLGNKSESRFLSTGFSYDQLGAEMGVKINIRKDPTYVDSFNFNITYNRLSATAIFRINFYSVVKDKPLDNILSQNILVSVKPEQVGNIRVDLKPYDIILKDDVIVTLEWVDTEGQNKKGEAIFFSLGLVNSGTVYKKSSHAKFKKYNSMGVGFNIDVRY